MAKFNVKFEQDKVFKVTFSGAPGPAGPTGPPGPGGAETDAEYLWAHRADVDAGSVGVGVNTGLASPGSTVTGNRGTAIGYNANSSTGGASLGNNADASGTNSIAIGRGSDVAANATGGIAIGFSAAVGDNHDHSVVLGHNSATTSNHQIMLGTSDDRVQVHSDVAGTEDEDNQLTSKKYVDNEISTHTHDVPDWNVSGDIANQPPISNEGSGITQVQVDATHSFRMGTATGRQVLVDQTTDFLVGHHNRMRSLSGSTPEHLTIECNEFDVEVKSNTNAHVSTFKIKDDGGIAIGTTGQNDLFNLNGIQQFLSNTDGTLTVNNNTLSVPLGNTSFDGNKITIGGSTGAAAEIEKHNDGGLRITLDSNEEDLAPVLDIYNGATAIVQVQADGDIQLNAVGKGIIMRSPDGTQVKRVFINNSGNLSTEDI